MTKGQGKHVINLFQAELQPKKPLWSLKRVVAVWAATFAFMFVWMLFGQYQVSSLNSEHAVLTSENTVLKAKLTELEVKLSQHKPSQALTDKLALLKLVLANKKVLYRQLTDRTRTNVTGFASAMTELSAMHHPDISLTTVSINNNDMTFTGVARAPESVPAWLAGFENSILLSGKAFVNFTLTENEQKLTEFTVSSKIEAEQLN
ncbi:MAG: PilN domain-containing protein [Colwellia sp.]|nr:PilN domain-containing protein [Colwellia sp.]